MPDIRNVSKAGNLMVVRFTDDTQQTLYPTPGRLWIAKKVVEPPPPPPDEEQPPPPPPGDGKWSHPLPGATLTSPYGPRSFDGFHWGADLSTGTGAVGQPVLAPADLKITIAAAEGSADDQSYGTGGNYVKGHTLDGKYTFSFFHMHSLGCSVNQIVRSGNAVGVEGARGNVSGMHLHFEAYIGQHNDPWAPPYGDPVDPLPILRANGVSI